MLEKWRKIYLLDPLWRLDLFTFDDAEMPGAYARVDISTAEYYFASIEIAESTFEMKEDEFMEIVNEALAHELLHILLIDFFRTSQVCAGENQELLEELKYKYEQFTTRLAKSYTNLDAKIIEKDELLKEVKEVCESGDIEKLKEILKGDKE